MMRTLKVILLVLLYANSFLICSAQSFTFRSFEENFPNRPINDLLIDEKGFLWIGTFGAGLHRFDGVSYESYLFEWKDSTSINSNFIVDLEEDQHGNIWVGTDNGICRYDPHTRKVTRLKLSYIQNPEDENISVLSILEAENGDLFLGCNGKGIVRLDSQKDYFTDIDASKFYQNLIVNDLVEDNSGNVFAATNAGLKVFSESEQLLTTPKLMSEHLLANTSVLSVFFDGNSLWVGTENQGLFQIKDYSISDPRVEQFPFTNKRIMDIALINGNEIICATENDGLFVLNKNSLELTQYLSENINQNSIEINSIWSLEVDQNSRLWLGYYNKGIGLSAKSSKKFQYLGKTIDNSNALRESSVNSILHQGDSIIWLGMDGGGIDKYYINKASYRHLSSENGYQGLANNTIQSMMLDEKGNLWVGTWERGIYFLPNSEKKFQNFNADNSGLQSNRILGFAEDSSGDIWIATFGTGVNKYSFTKNEFKQVLTQEVIDYGLSYADVRDVLIDDNEAIWVGSTSGLFKIVIAEGDTIIESFRDKYESQKIHPNFNHVLSLYQDDKGKIWIGTDGAGLFSVDEVTDSLIWYNDYLKLQIYTVCGITQDYEGSVWVTGKSGIAKVNEQAHSVAHYKKKDGLTTNDFNYNAILSHPSNTLYFGSLNGVNSIKPSVLDIDTTNINTYLTKLRVFNKEVKPGEKNSPIKKSLAETESIILEPDQSIFTIEYTGINFSYPEQIEFAYYLEGLESDWNYVATQRSATYTSLRHGDYTFKLRAANIDGVWSNHITTLKIKVLPAWYKSNWALVCYIVLFLGGLILMNFILRIRLRERQQVVYERERHQQNEELTQKKLQFFTNISHEFRTPLTLILNPLSELTYLNSLSDGVRRSLFTVQRNAQRLERLIDELMDFRKLNSGKLKIHIHKIDLLGFTRELTKYFAQEAENNEVELVVHGDAATYWGWVDSGLVEKMLFNLLSNAFKVTPEKGVIDLHITEVKKILPMVKNEEIEVIRISVSDTGSGLAQDHLNKIFERFYQVQQLGQRYFSGTGIGLEVVKSFIELHKGVVEVESKEGEGTTFHLYFPLGKEHFQSDDFVKGEYPGKKEFLVTDSLEKNDQSNYEVSENTKKYTILVVDDNIELRKFIRNELKEFYRVEIAKNGEEGVQMALRHLPDVIITDVMMPEMDGFEFCEKIKIDIKTSHIPVIMLTAKSTSEDQLFGIDKGADIYMTKPFDIALLRARIKQLLKSRQVIFDKYLKGIGEVEEAKETTSVDRDFMHSILNYINDHLNDPQLSVESIAEEVSLSRSQLYRKVKALTGLNVNEFIRRIRLQQAKKLLNLGNANINEVSHKVGFSSASYFSKCYKEYFGSLPTDERKAQ